MATWLVNMLLNFKYVVIKIQHAVINITYVPTTKQATYKKRNRMRQSMSF